MEFDIEEAQQLIDSGYSARKVSILLGVHHSKVCRLIERGLIHVDYVPFDEVEDKTQLTQNFEWLWEEDVLEEICYKLFDDEKVNLSLFLGDSYTKVGVYVRDVYGDIFNYLLDKDFHILKEGISLNCITCGSEYPISNYSRNKKGTFGITKECSKCVYKRVKRLWSESEEYRSKMKIHGHNRRAKERLLINDLTIEDLDEINEFFNGCALTGSEDFQLDHAIPIAVGHAGTTKSNIIPLRQDLNFNKKKANIFEWFEANRQRFGLSQPKFNTLIEYLASANAMTTEEYRDYVYFCHANSRTLDDIIREGEDGVD